MINRSGIKRAVGGVLAAAAISLTPLAGGVVSAETLNIGVGELQECTISKSMDSTSTSLSGYNSWETNFGRTY